MSQRLPEEWFIEDERTNAAIAWLFAVVLALSAVGNVLAGELVTATTAVVAVVVTVVPAWVGRSWRRTIPWPLLALTVLPFGLSAAELPFVAGFVRSIAVATLALLVVVALQLTTSIRMTPGFAVWFATIATLGVAGIWAFGSWLSAEYLGTVFFETNTELMVFFLTTLVAGLIAAGVFVWYFRRRLRANAARDSTGEIA
jgi:hypothetical protein